MLFQQAYYRIYHKIKLAFYRGYDENILLYCKIYFFDDYFLTLMNIMIAVTS